MKCKGREKLQNERHNAVKLEYGEKYLNMIFRIAVWVLRTEYGFGIKRLRYVTDIATKRFLSDINKYTPYSIQRITGHHTESLTEEQKYAETCADMNYAYENNLNRIGYNPDIDAMMDIPDRFLKIYRDDDSLNIIHCRGDYYERTAREAGKSFIRLLMIVLHDEYRWGTKWLSGFFQSVMRLHSEWMEDFLGEKKATVGSGWKLSEELSRRLRDEWRLTVSYDLENDVIVIGEV